MRNRYVLIAISLAALVIVALHTLSLASKQNFGIRAKVTIPHDHKTLAITFEDGVMARHWLPWAQIDPDMTWKASQSPDGAPARFNLQYLEDWGRGSTLNWQGNEHAGSGSVTIRAFQRSETISMTNVRQEYKHRGIRWGHTSITLTRVDEYETDVEIVMIGSRDWLRRIEANFRDHRLEYEPLLERGLANLKVKISGR